MINCFITFLEESAAKADALYILGDLFEYWAGDDAIAAGAHSQTIEALRQLHQNGVSTYLIHGNRDFLLGDTFSKTSKIKILPDPTLIQLYGKSILLSHGDALCTDDIAYQAFRDEVRTASWKKKFLSQPLSQRIAYIESIRAKSEQEKSVKSMQIMDVNPTAVAELLQKHHYPSTIVHGHTHRPKHHEHHVNGHTCERWVLGDWYDHGSYLKLDEKGFHEHKL
jgi:UDP-2,3-diacylglucosamine hydrolase